MSHLVIDEINLANLTWYFPSQVNVGADHRVLDGATVARFCGEWKQFIEKPELMMLHMKWEIFKNVQNRRWPVLIVCREDKGKMYSDLHKSIAMAFAAKGGKLGFDSANIVAGSSWCLYMKRRHQPSNLFKTHCFSRIASIMLDHLGDEIPDFETMPLSLALRCMLLCLSEELVT